MMIFIVYSMFVFLLIFSISKKHYILSKTMNSLAFIGVAIYCAFVSQHLSLLFAILPALIGCLAGDFILATHHRRSFLYGLSCFLVANICYVFYLSNFKMITVQEIIFPVLAVIIVIMFSYLPKMEYGQYEKPILVYTFMITFAMTRSITVYLSLSTPMFLCCMLGFILYFLSDFILLFERFYECRYQKFLKVMNLLTYYYGIYFIAYSLIY